MAISISGGRVQWHKGIRKLEWLAVAILGGALLAACGGVELEDGNESESAEPARETASPLVGGTATNARPEIGTLGFCTATLVDPRYIVTASHCFGYTTGPRNDTFTIRSTTGAWLARVHGRSVLRAGHCWARATSRSVG